MFSKAERVLLNDPNIKRFNCPPLSGTSASDQPHPGPTQYHPQPPRRSTKRHGFLKGSRAPLNAVELKNDVPGPGWYSAESPRTFPLPPPLPRTVRTSPRVAQAPRETGLLALEDSQRPPASSGAAAGASGSGGTRAQPAAPQNLAEPIFGRRTARHFNMININNAHSLREYDEVRVGKPGPATYTIPSTFEPPPDPAATTTSPSNRALALRSTAGGGTQQQQQPALMCSAAMHSTGHNMLENLDGRRFKLIESLPAPGAYDPQPPSRPRGGLISRLPRGLDQQPGSGVGGGVGGGGGGGAGGGGGGGGGKGATPGPGHYSAPPLPSKKLPVQIPATPRNLNHIVCGTDLRRMRRLPGPASYHPIYQNIVKQDYTV